MNDEYLSSTVLCFPEDRSLLPMADIGQSSLSKNEAPRGVVVLLNVARGFGRNLESFEKLPDFFLARIVAKKLIPAIDD